MDTSEEIADLAAALATAQGEMAHAAKDRSNPAFKSRYADLASIVDACREPLSRHGIAVLQPPTVALSENGVLVSVETRFIHKSGQWASTSLSSWVPDAKAQSIGSAITYLRRYGLAAMAGVAPEDDDGNGASQPSQPRREQPKREDGMTVADAVAMVVKYFPHLEVQAKQIANAGGSADFRIDKLRELYKAQGKPATTAAPEGEEASE